MLRTNGSAVLPVVTWAPTSPSHEIVSILSSPDGNELITGGNDGNIILWSYHGEHRYFPRWMVSGHRRAVKNLCWASLQQENRYFISHSESNELALWDLVDGRCLEFKIDTRYHHHMIKSHQPGHLDYRLLFCCGRYAHIVVIHSMSLSVLFNLASQSQPDWISSFMIFTHPSKRHDVVLGISFSNAATLWTLNGEEIQGEVKYEHESRVIDCQTAVLSVHCCSSLPRCVLLVCRSAWLLMDAMICAVFFSHTCPEGDALVGGEFVGDSAVIVYCRSGAAHLYRLRELLPSGRTSIDPNMAQLIASFSPFTDHNSTSPSHYCCYSINQSSTEISLVGGTNFGQVLFWDVKSIPDNPTSKLTIPPLSISDLQSVWDKHCSHNLLKDLSVSLQDTSRLTSECYEPSFSITVCVQIFQMLSSRPNSPSRVCPPRIAIGLSNGTIIVLRLTDFLQSVYLKSPVHKSSSYSNLHNLLKLSRLRLEGHVGPVTSLLHPASTDEQWISTSDAKVPRIPQFNPDHLLSGGADFTVRLWDLDPWRESNVDRILSKQMCRPSSSTDAEPRSPVNLAVFHCHSSPCIALTVGPPAQALSEASAGNSRLNSCICSVGCDGSVALVSLTEQRPLLLTGSLNKVSASVVVALGWRVPEDLLFIAHSDGSLEIWDVTAGCLDRFETAQNARDLFEQAHFIVEIQDSLSSFNLSVPLLSHQTMSTSSTPIPVFSPSLYGTVSHPASAGSSTFVSPARIRRTIRGQNSYHKPPSMLQLQTVGSTRYMDKIPHRNLAAGPAAFVFHWDLETLIVDLLTCCDKEALTNPESMELVHSTLRNFLQLLMSVIHPWDADRTTDLMVEACCGFSRAIIGETGLRLRPNICLGSLSKHGCLALSMPGWPSRPPTEHWSSVSARLYSLSRSISTNLLLFEFSLVQAMTHLSPAVSAELFGLSVDKSGNTSTIIPDWLTLSGYLCGPLLQSISMHGQRSSICSPELEFLAHKWQDRSFMIRYAARTLLLALLDTFSHETRTAIVNYWVSLLPSFPGMTSYKQTANSSIASPNLTPHLNGMPHSSRHSPQPHHVSRQQSLPHSDGNKITRRRPSVVSNEENSFGTGTSPQLSASEPDTANLLHTSEFVSLSNLDSCEDLVSVVSSAHWWSVLSGYRISAREHARLQAVAIVLLGVIGSRFGSSDKPISPMVASRDITDRYSQDKLALRESHHDVGNSSCPHRSDTVQSGFGSDNHHLAFSVSHCLTALLFHRVPDLSEKSFPEPSSNKPQNESALSTMHASNLTHLLMSSTTSSLRRAAIDLLGRGFPVWEPHVDLAQVINTLLNISNNAKATVATLSEWQPLPEHVDLIRTAREALWQIAFSRPKSVILHLSLEVRRLGGQVGSMASQSTAAPMNQLQAGSRQTAQTDGSQSRRDSLTIPDPRTANQGRKMTVMMASPAVSTPLFVSPVPPLKTLSTEPATNAAIPCSPLFVAREEIIELLEQICTKRSNDVLPVLTEVVEVVIACLDKTRLKERGFDFVFPVLNKFTMFGTHTRLQKACVGGFNGSLTFFDFKVGRFFTTPAHNGHVTAVRFHEDGRLVASYSTRDGTVKIWQLHTAGLFGIGGQQVKAVSSHPVPPLHSPSSGAQIVASPDDHFCPDRPRIWIEWPDLHTIQVTSHDGIKRRITV